MVLDNILMAQAALYGIKIAAYTWMKETYRIGLEESGDVQKAEELRKWSEGMLGIRRRALAYLLPTPLDVIVAAYGRIRQDRKYQLEDKTATPS